MADINMEDLDRAIGALPQDDEGDQGTAGTPDNPPDNDQQQPPAGQPPGTQATPPDPYHALSREQIIKENEELKQKLLDQVNPHAAQPEAASPPAEVKDELEAKMEEAFAWATDPDQVKALGPAEFAKKMAQSMKQLVGSFYDHTEQSRMQRTKVIMDAAQEYSELKTDKDYRALVSDIINSATKVGNSISLKEACAKADRYLKIDRKAAEPPAPAQPGAGDTPPPNSQQLPNTDVENGTRAPGGGEAPDGSGGSILKGTSRRNGPLGGL